MYIILKLDSNVMGSHAASESDQLNQNMAEVAWTAFSISTAFVILIFIVTCVRVLIIGKYYNNDYLEYVKPGRRYLRWQGQILFALTFFISEYFGSCLKIEHRIII